MKPLAKNIKKGRNKKGWSRSTLARKLSTPDEPVTEDMVYNMESGRKKIPCEIVIIAMEHFGITPDQMYPFVINEDFWKE